MDTNNGQVNPNDNNSKENLNLKTNISLEKNQPKSIEDVDNELKKLDEEDTQEALQKVNKRRELLIQSYNMKLEKLAKDQAKYSELDELMRATKNKGTYLDFSVVLKDEDGKELMKVTIESNLSHSDIASIKDQLFSKMGQLNSNVGRYKKHELQTQNKEAHSLYAAQFRK